MRAVSQARLEQACEALFGERPPYEKLARLDSKALKSLFRKRALELHPDRHAKAPEHVKARLTARFREVNAAYELLEGILAKGNLARPAPPPAPASPAKAPKRAASPQPNVRLRQSNTFLGTFLVWRGAITFQQLLEALAHQRRSRPRLGELACQWGWLDARTLEAALGSRAPPGRIAERAVRLGLLSAVQAKALLRHQQSLQRPLGQHLVRMGLLSAEELSGYLSELARHNEQARL